MRFSIDGGRLLAVAVLMLSACASRVVRPEEALARYLAAARAGRVAEAYAMMSDGYRRDHDATAFGRAVREHRQDLDAASARLSAGAPTVELRAEARYGDGEVLPLVMEGGAWRIAADPTEFYPQSTPAEALRSFLLAVERKRYDVVLRFVPSRARKSVTLDQLRVRWEGEKRTELTFEIAEVRAHLAEPIDVSGDEARLALGEKRQVRLSREEGAWKIEALR